MLYKSFSDLGRWKESNFARQRPEDTTTIGKVINKHIQWSRLPTKLLNNI